MLLEMIITMKRCYNLLLVMIPKIKNLSVKVFNSKWKNIELAKIFNLLKY